MKSIVYYNLSTNWYDIVEHFNKFIPIDESGNPCTKDEIGNTKMDIALYWLSLKIHEHTGGIDQRRINMSLTLEVKMAIRFDTVELLTMYSAFLKSTIIPSWSVNENVELNVVNHTLIVRTF